MRSIVPRDQLSPVPAAAPEPGLTSIVIPCFNQRRFLADAIESALAQDQAEVVVVDDGSTDGAADVAARYPGVRLLRTRNRGVAAARNTGLVAARGEFVLFLDADDRLRIGAVAALRAALQADRASPFAHGLFQPIDEAGLPRRAPAPPRGEGTAYEALLQSNFICAPATVLFRRAALVRCGGFAVGVDPAADYDVYLALAREMPPVAVPTVVADYRAHGASMSRRADWMLRSTLRVHTNTRANLRTPAERRAWTAGQTFWREYYGTRLVEQIRAHWRARALGSLLWCATVLAWYSPRVLFRHLVKKIMLLRSSGHRTRYSANRSSS